jgi:hypothetical protein
MQNDIDQLSRRAFVKLAGVAAAGFSLLSRRTEAQKGAPTTIALFDGKTLDGWIQIENSSISLSAGAITDQAAFVAKLANGTDMVSLFLHGRLEDLVKADLAAYSVTNANAKALMSAVVKDLNQVIQGPSIYDVARFSNTVLRPETERLLQQDVHGLQLARLNMLLLEDAYPAELAKKLCDRLGGKGWRYSQLRHWARSHVYSE